ncbi:hypothetical protein GQ53DRAFT_525178 [Thozetella sp. PMI_491]|nr:hypothetical protein GQ53DRAFT_525178 [Thozetella sp. PMI_491]
MRVIFPYTFARLASGDPAPTEESVIYHMRVACRTTHRGELVPDWRGFERRCSAKSVCILGRGRGWGCGCGCGCGHGRGHGHDSGPWSGSLVLAVTHCYSWTTQLVWLGCAPLCGGHGWA